MHMSKRICAEEHVQWIGANPRRRDGDARICEAREVLVARSLGSLVLALMGCGAAQDGAVADEAPVVARVAAERVAAGERCPEVQDGGPRAPAAVDGDGDGIVDGDDQCPEEAENPNGFHDRDGCHDLVPSELVDVREVLAEPCFVGRTAQLSRKARRGLRAYAEILADYPDVAIEITSHSRRMRSDARANELTQRRAEAVVDELVRLGVARERLAARGAGMSESYCCEAPCDGPQRLEVQVLVR
jgi:outer membrane protein OmpA-like peptidoglycan-associated protein